MSRVSVLTPIGRGAVATVRLEGMAALDGSPPLFMAANGRPIGGQPINHVCFGRWGATDTEDVVACRLADDVTEIHCHGGNAAVARIVADLTARGAVLRERTDTVMHTDSVEATCRTALSRAATMRTADILWQQCAGRLAQALSRLPSLPDSEAQQQAREMLQWAHFGTHLTQPWQVVLFGRPNVGKSSLINRLVGYGRSIIFDEPGTTRDVVTVEAALDGWPVAFSDTAGIRDHADVLEREGIARALRQLESADLRVLLLDLSHPLCDEDRQLIGDWPDTLIVAHKSDLPGQWDASTIDALAVSSITGAGIEQLVSTLVQRLIPRVPPPMTMLPIDALQASYLATFLPDANSCS